MLTHFGGSRLQSHRHVCGKSRPTEGLRRPLGPAARTNPESTPVGRPAPGPTPKPPLLPLFSPPVPRRVALQRACLCPHRPVTLVFQSCRQRGRGTGDTLGATRGPLWKLSAGLRPSLPAPHSVPLEGTWRSLSCFSCRWHPRTLILSPSDARGSLQKAEARSVEVPCPWSPRWGRDVSIHHRQTMSPAFPIVPKVFSGCPRDRTRAWDTPEASP